MKKALFTFLASLFFSIAFTQVSEKEKLFITKYNLSPNFFSPTYNARLSIETYYDSLSKAKGAKTIPPADMIEEASNLFLQKNMHDKAYWLLRWNLENYPAVYSIYNSMAVYYMRRGDLDRAFG